MQSAVTVATGQAAPVDCVPPPAVDLNSASLSTSPSTTTTAGLCRLTNNTTTTTADQNSNVMVPVETSNHSDPQHDVVGETTLDDSSVSAQQPSTLTLRLIMQGKVRRSNYSHSFIYTIRDTVLRISHCSVWGVITAHNLPLLECDDRNIAAQHPAVSGRTHRRSWNKNVSTPSTVYYFSFHSRNTLYIVLKCIHGSAADVCFVPLMI